MAQLSNEQLAAILEMEDLHSREKKLAQQQAMATHLRGTGLQPSARMDAGSQMARALQGFGAAQGYRQGQREIDALGKSRDATMAKIKAALLQQPPTQTPQVNSQGAFGADILQGGY
jgi:hypothetical protein